jgi:hypothetical protein
VTDEVTQASIYGQLIREAACDPDVASLSFFGFRDDGLRTGFQAGLERADGTQRPSAAAVQAAIPDGCTGLARMWTPGVSVLGAKVAVLGKGSDVTARVAAGEDARAKVCVRSVALMYATPERCRSVTVQGLRSLTVDVRAQVVAAARVEVAVQFAAEANRARRTLVQTVLTR